MNHNKKERLEKIFIFSLVLIALIVYGIYSLVVPDLGRETALCPSKRFFNLECAGCGCSRMAKALLAGDLYQAFRFNPGIFCMMPFFILEGIRESIYYSKNRSLSSHFEKFLMFIAIILVIYGIIRNIPMLNWLAPTYV